MPMNNEVDNKKINFNDKEVAQVETVVEEPVKPKIAQNRVTVLISDGARFDPNTGKELTKKFYQSFSRSEWEQFQKNAKSLGMSYELIYEPKWK